ncbi:MAG: flagellar assembly protein FliW [Candidatus Magnetobacterium sp. LHC-1]|uniref:Flagellar assembly factor FliW n=1 Tax=Candidatus Magnetobacterium casense TaxID=1455061 RepID=A0ABS6RV72_9BACT|nr:flagellar assembly protein FliW [Candidatus Magnetobacterium casensis]MBF0606441.1 flagellar assembly protein FliW [Nitrospirota bacterium]MBV6340529.1 flagellar assembly protein FliW [Candidatus Magnetobacterium casensis]
MIQTGKIIEFPEGLLGFADLKRYILIDHKDTPLKWLQAIDDPDIAFIVTAPAIVSTDFTLTIDSATKKYLEAENDADIVVLVIIRVDNGQVIANFRGPLVFNAAKMRGIQIVLDKL